MLRQELLLFPASHGGDLAETFGLENCHRASVLGLNKPPGVSRLILLSCTGLAWLTSIIIDDLFQLHTPTSTPTVFGTDTTVEPKQCQCLLKEYVKNLSP